MEERKNRLALYICLLLHFFCHQAFPLNLDLNNLTVYSGPQGSYFGFSVDFHRSSGNKVSVLVGAPKANTSQAGVTEGGSVFICPWTAEGGPCQTLTFDSTGDEEFSLQTVRLKAFKSYQWFGASVRSLKSHILACAPLFHWNAIDEEGESGRTPVGNCKIMNVQTTEVADYSPCRDMIADYVYKARNYYSDKRYCEAGFATDTTKDGKILLGAPGGYYFQGQVIAANLTNILNSAKTTNPLHSVSGMISSTESGGYDVYQGYSIAIGEFTGDSTPDYVVGVPNDLNTAGSVKIYNGQSRHTLRVFHTFYGTQVTAYFGHSVAVTDINNDGRDDILIGAPLFMERQSSQHLQEVGQVCIYLQKERSMFSSKPDQKLTGSVVQGRFGSAIAPLGDIDMDGFNDVAVGAPFSEENGQVFIFMGQSDGLSPQCTQVLESPFRPLGSAAAFGFTLRGGTDIDDNGYPDLIVGAWGASQIAIYRALAVVRAKAQLSLHPDFLNPDVKLCQLPKTSQHVSCFTISLCVSVSGHSIPDEIVLNTELQLDKMKQKMARRTLFLQTNQPQEHFSLTIQRDRGEACVNRTAYLRPESEIKDKLSPIFTALNFSLGGSATAVLHGQTAVIAQTRIILDCGSDNVCIPDLRLTANAGTDRLLIGEENPVLMVIQAENRGEGAYETELQIRPPPFTHYQGVLSDREGFSRLVCAQKKDNGTVVVVCDLGNPMKQDQELQAGLYFSVGNLEEVESHVSFQLQIKSKNSLNATSNEVNLRINVSAMANLEMRGGSSPVECVLPIDQWETKEVPTTLAEVGPLVEHVYELRNLGPGKVNARLEVDYPSQLQGELLLYVFANASEEHLTCHTNYPDIDQYKLTQHQETSNTTVRPAHHIEKRDAGPEPQPIRKETVHVNCSGEVSCLRFVCEAAGLDRGSSAVVRVMSRLWVRTFLERPYENYVLHSTASYKVLDFVSKIQPRVLPRGHAETQTSVVWRTPDGEKEVPVWWIVVAVISGLLLLALLNFIFWKVGFFKRNRPPSGDEDDTQDLKEGEDDA